MKPDIKDFEGYSRRELAELYRMVFDAKGARYQLISKEFKGYPILEAADEDKLYSLVLVWDDKPIKNVDEVEKEVYEFVNESSWDGSTSLNVYITTLSEISEKVDSLLLLRFGGLKFNPQFYGLDWLQGNLNKYDGLFQKWKKKVEASRQGTHPKHALSIEENDQTLVDKGYQNQGLIGFVYSKDTGEESIPLTQVLINSSEDYFYYLHRRNETFSDNDTSEEKVIGYLSLSRNSGTNLELNRYKREEGSFLDHFYCTEPNEELLQQFNYERERADFEHKYLFPKPAENLRPLYVYSNKPEIRLFSSLKVEESKAYLSAEKVQKLIASKHASEAKFLWLNMSQDFWKDTKTNPEPTFLLEAVNLENLPKGLTEGDLVLTKYLKSDKISGLFEYVNYDPESARAKFKKLYEFSNKPLVDDLKIISGFNDAYTSFSPYKLYELKADLFLEVINTTELGKQDTKWSETHPEVDALYQKSGDRKKGNASYKNEQRSTTIDGDIDFEIPDLLDIENDVRSFALLLASNNVKPPVAIALFGKWGSGKSFFMKLLQKRISELSINQGFLLHPDDIKTNRRKNTDEDLFCKGIAQIEFNAWSYLDANLWAGLVTSIFEKLNEYISETTKSGVAKMKVQEELKKRLKTLQTKKLTAEERREELQNLKTGYQIEGKKLKESIVSNFSDKILSFIDPDDDLKTVHSRISKDGYLAELSTQLNHSKLEEEAETFKSFVRNLKKVKPLLKYVIPAGVGILVAISIQRFSIELNITWSAIIPFLGSLGIDLGFLKNRYNKVKSYVKGFNDLIDSNSALKAEVVNHKLLAENAREQIEQANVQIEELNKDIDNFKSYMEEEIHQEAIRDFIQTRADHTDYKDKLGIVSIIRRDFETLSELFYHGSDANVGASTIDASEKQVIREQFQKGKRLERIILYIDDLDRCSDKKVLEVIQAVHLLMAFPLFNVVVGVDKKCVTNALLLKTKLKYRKIANIKEIEKIGIEMISPSDYLEKIFQIPFELKEPEEKDINALTDSLLNDQIQKETLDSEIEKPKAVDEIEEHSSEEIRFQISSDDLSDEPPIMSLLTQKGKQEDESTVEDQTVTEEQEPKKMVTATLNNLELSQLEVDQLKEILFLVRNTPRTIKRFINIYRIIRAHNRPDTNDEMTNDDHLAIMLLLALGIGEHKAAGGDLKRLIAQNPNRFVTMYVQETKELKELEKEILQRGSINKLMRFKGDLLQKHIPFVSRFSFGKEEQSKVESDSTTT